MTNPEFYVAKAATGFVCGFLHVLAAVLWCLGCNAIFQESQRSHPVKMVENAHGNAFNSDFLQTFKRLLTLRWKPGFSLGRKLFVRSFYSHVS